MIKEVAQEKNKQSNGVTFSIYPPSFTKEPNLSEELFVFKKKASRKDRQFITNVIKVVEKHLDNENLTVNLLSQTLYISPSQLYRKILGITGYTATQFIRHLRLSKARIMLELEMGNISEIAHQTGFSPCYFSKCFSKKYGYPPKTLLK